MKFKKKSEERFMDNFPLLQKKVYGKPLVYLDNAATTQKPESVLKAMDSYYRECNANVHRGIHYLAEQATMAYEEVREKVAQFISAKREEIIFTKSTTEALNLLAYSLTATLEKGDEIIVSLLEHHSNFVPWQQLALQRGITVKYIPLTPSGELDFKAYKQLLTPRTKIVAVTAVSNVLGTITPLQQMIQEAHAIGAKVVVDAAQAIAFLPIDCKSLNCDFLAFSGHKCYGPTGVGVLYGKSQLLTELPPFLFGGDMIETVTKEKTTFAEPPAKFEAGTPNIAEVIGLGAAIDFLQQHPKRKEHLEEVTQYAVKALQQIPEVTVYGPKERGPVISFTLENIAPHDITALLDKQGIASRAGHLCAMPLLQEFNLSGVTRVSFACYTKKIEIDSLVTALKRIVEVCR